MDAASFSTSSLHSTKHDVFISFRGEDIRKNFLSHLKAAFKRDNIDAFIDDNLKKGDDIGGALSEAIEESRLSVVIFSENYATSKWCLNELLKIVECKDKNEEEKNVRKKWVKSTKKEDLRNDLVSHILQDKAMIPTPDLPPEIKKRLENKKVLIVLDDVNKKDQIEYLVGRDGGWFLPGSVIIVTTTNEKIIKDCTAQYHVTELNSGDALELFSLRAFKTKTPPDESEYKEISDMAVSYAKGIPRALPLFLGVKT